MVLGMEPRRSQVLGKHSPLSHPPDFCDSFLLTFLKIRIRINPFKKASALSTKVIEGERGEWVVGGLLLLIYTFFFFFFCYTGV
jgi:hypothetical protein